MVDVVLVANRSNVVAGTIESDAEQSCLRMCPPLLILGGESVWYAANSGAEEQTNGSAVPMDRP